MGRANNRACTTLNTNAPRSKGHHQHQADIAGGCQPSRSAVVIHHLSAASLVEQHFRPPAMATVGNRHAAQGASTATRRLRIRHAAGPAGEFLPRSGDPATQLFRGHGSNQRASNGATHQRLVAVGQQRFWPLRSANRVGNPQCLRILHPAKSARWPPAARALSNASANSMRGKPSGGQLHQYVARGNIHALFIERALISPTATTSSGSDGAQ